MGHLGKVRQSKIPESLNTIKLEEIAELGKKLVPGTGEKNCAKGTHAHFKYLLMAISVPGKKMKASTSFSSTLVC